MTRRCMTLAILGLAATTVAATIGACAPAAVSSGIPTNALSSSADASTAPSESGSAGASGPATAGSPGLTGGDASASPSAPASATPSTGFAFPASAGLAYYEKAGLTCSAPAPSDVADGWTIQECSGRDGEGQRLLVGVVTDQDGALGDAYASVSGAKSGDLVGPEQAIEHLSGFLGAMIGDQRASAQLKWLAGSMGNAYEETTDADLLIATYRRPRDDRRTVWLEVAGPGYPVPPAP